MATLAGHTKAAPVAWTRAAVWMLGAVVVVLAVLTVGTGSGYLPAPSVLGQDYVAYRDATLRFLGGQGFYEPRQLAGPWTFETYREVLYPPSSLAVFVPMAFLPAILWWVIPAGVIAWSVRVHRPHPLGLVFIAVALLSRLSVYAWFVGNPGIWLAAAVAAATMWGSGPLVLFKPSYFPLAIVGLARRGWWAGAVIVGVAVLLTLPLWADYLNVLRNAPALGYSVLSDIPVVAVPLLAWFSRRGGSPAGRATAPSPLTRSARASG